MSFPSPHLFSYELSRILTLPSEQSLSLQGALISNANVISFVIFSRHDTRRGEPDPDVRPDQQQDRPRAEEDPLGAIGYHLVEWLLAGEKMEQIIANNL